ncbi:MAG: hypothetical protein KGZ97_09655, partial [Bacteroidetes bacterium]|nr:hypothetical protein [Bacteroidota bacterium]
MTAPFKVLRGLEIDLPVLDEGAIAFTTDSHKFFVGSSTGNVEITNQVANMTDYLDKATFDADDDGVVDVAASVDWSGVQNVPTQVSNLTQDVIDDSHAHNNTTALDNVTQSVVDNSHAANVLGTKVLDETGLSDGDVIKYDLTLDKWVVASDNEGTG